MKPKRCSWWRGHDWGPGRLTGPLSMVETCARCGWHKIFNGALDEAYLYEPDAFEENR